MSLLDELGNYTIERGSVEITTKDEITTKSEVNTKRSEKKNNKKTKTKKKPNMKNIKLKEFIKKYNYDFGNDIDRTMYLMKITRVENKAYTKQTITPEEMLKTKISKLYKKYPWTVIKNGIYIKNNSDKNTYQLYISDTKMKNDFDFLLFRYPSF